MPNLARPSPARPPSRRWLVPVTLLLVLAVGAAALLLLRRPAKPARPLVATPPSEASPAATAAVLAEPAASPEDRRFQPPKLVTSLPVRYPEQAFLNRVEGTVLVKFSVDDTGHVTEVIVSKSSGSVLLDAVVLEYDLKKWTFQPAQLDGKPVSGTVEREFEFHLDPKEQRALAEERLKIPVGIPDPPYPKEALALKPQGTCEVSVTWTAAGLVDTIILTKSSGSNTLDRVALRFAFMHWHLDPKEDAKKEFTKTMTFTPPLGPNDTPPPL